MTPTPLTPRIDEFSQGIGAPTVSKTTWNPGKGLEETRRRESEMTQRYQTQQEEIANADPVIQRINYLEAEVRLLKAQFTQLELDNRD